MFPEAMGRVYITSTLMKWREASLTEVGRKVGAWGTQSRQQSTIFLNCGRYPITSRMPRCAILKTAMRDPEIIETDLMEISAIADDLVKFERIVAWCASHPDEVPFALHQLLKQKEVGPDQS